MSIKISELPQATSVGSSDIVPIVQGGTTKQATAEMINTDNYSTTEQKVGTWIDGKSVYKKTYVLSFNISDNTGEATVNIADINIDTLVRVDGATKALLASTYQRDFTHAYAYGGTSVTEYSGMFIRDNTLLYRYRGMQLSNAYLTIYYTKTTDTATRSLNLMRGENTGSLVGLGDKAEVSDETLEKVKLDETTEVKEVEATEQTKEVEGSGDLIK